MLGIKLLIIVLFLFSFSEAVQSGTIRQENRRESGVTRFRRAAKVVGFGPSLAFLSQNSSAVGGTGFWTQPAGQGYISAESPFFICPPSYPCRDYNNLCCMPYFATGGRVRRCPNSCKD
eukprot:GFUD01060084.1.p1 GENE.GFUD01060084.1~~GFUD01060084.1.p1  ORF type:complete len:119 (-),score=1.08 GFUD01060084.1:23-379(-)